MRLVFRTTLFALAAGCGDNNKVATDAPAAIDARTLDALFEMDAPAADAAPDAAPTFNYPQTAAQLTSVVGGTWTDGWLLDEKTGTMKPTFGDMILTPNGAPTLGVAGPIANDFAVKMLVNSDYLEGDDHLFPGLPFHANTDDVCVAWVARNDEATSPVAVILGNWASSDQGWLIYDDGADHMVLGKSTAESVTVDMPAVGSWYVGLAAFDKTANQMKLAVHNLDDATKNTSAGLAFTSFTGPFGPPKLLRVGKGLGTEIGKLETVSAVYVGVGANACAGMAANLETAAANLATRIKTGSNN